MEVATGRSQGKEKVLEPGRGSARLHCVEHLLQDGLHNKKKKLFCRM